MLIREKCAYLNSRARYCVPPVVWSSVVFGPDTVTHPVSINLAMIIINTNMTPHTKKILFNVQTIPDHKERITIHVEALNDTVIILQNDLNEPLVRSINNRSIHPGWSV